MNKAYIFATILILISLSQCDVFPGCDGTVNNEALLTAPPKLNKTVPNGKLYVSPYDGRYFYVVVVNGSAYEMGYAYGQLLKEEIPQMYSAFFKWAAYYLENNVSSVITKLPSFLRNALGKIGVKLVRGLLDLNYLITEKYTPKHWNEEFRGLSDATKISIWTIRQVNLLPEFLKASCSIMGGYGLSTASGKTIHLRSLDWEEHAPISKFPAVAIYHPTEPNSVPFSNIAWVGFLGCLTCYNSQHVGIGERLGDAPNKDQTRLGTPWTYVLRDTLQYSSTLNQAIDYLQNAKRTCSVYLGVGQIDDFYITEYCAAYLNVYNWSTWHHDPNHPSMVDLLWKEYRDNTACFKNVLSFYYGYINPETVYRILAPLGQTGDSQVVVMDYANDTIYCQYPNPVTFDPAYVRPILKLDLRPFFDPQILE